MSSFLKINPFNKIFKGNMPNFIPLFPFLFMAVYFIFTSSFFSRYWADDFCAGAVNNQMGFWASQRMWWFSWSGRYSYNAALQFFIKFGPQLNKFLPILIVLGMVVSSYPVFKRISLKFSHSTLSAIISAFLFIVLILINTPNLIQSVYWLTGALVYAMPFVFMNTFLSVVVWSDYGRLKKYPGLTFVLCFFLLFVAGGFVETFALAAVVFVITLSICNELLLWKNKKQVRILLLIGLAGLLSSLIIMSLSPGMANRSSTLNTERDIGLILNSTLLGTKWDILRLFTINTFVLSLMMVFILVFKFTDGYYNKQMQIHFTLRRIYLMLIFYLLGLIGSASAVVGLGFYSMGITPPERAKFVIIYLLFCYIVGVSFILSLILLKLLNKTALLIVNKTMTIMLITASVFVTILTYNHWNRLLNEIKTYANEWDLRENEIYKQIAEGKDAITIHYLKPVGELDGFTDNKGWVGGCAAGYYQVKELKVIN